MNLYIFLDEGGNFDFSPNGTKYFTLTCVTMLRPFNMAGPLDELKYDLIEEGMEIEYFHAAEDRQRVRDRVFSIIKKNLDHIQIDTLVVEKRKTIPDLREIFHFYPRMIGYLLQYPMQRRILNHYSVNDFEQVIIVTDELPLKKKRDAVEKAIRGTLKHLPLGTAYRIMHHSSKSSMELQIADYCNWAIFRKWEREDPRSYQLIQRGVQSEFDIFRGGTTYYY